MRSFEWADEPFSKKLWMPTVQPSPWLRLEGMMNGEYPRRMMDQTIIGGPFVRYVPDPGTMFLVVEKIGAKEFVRAICPLVIWDRWGSYTVGAYRRCGCDETEDYWVEKIEEVIVTDAMTVYQVPLVEWMTNWKGMNGASQTKPIPPSPPPSWGTGGG